jgi:hypothetical protein
MRIKTIQLTQFKRFDDLTIDLGDQPRKIVALVGPNGSGKSSVFDAFEQKLQDHVGVDRTFEPWFYSKKWFDAVNPEQTYDKHRAIRIVAEGSHTFGRTSFYVRSAYRFTSSLLVTAIQRKGDMILDTARPGASIALDQRLQTNYERLLGRLLEEFWNGVRTGQQTREELIGKINARLERVLEIRISDLGNVSAGKGQLFFEKGSSKSFPFENLSAGEKEVVDMLIDFEVKAPVYSDTVYCIDEPELHLNTAIQRKLLNELAKLIPGGCQLWVATHSVGFLRALQKDLGDQAQIIDFSEKDYFTGAHTIRPIKPSRANWKRIFGTALEDLTGLIAPETVVYCEGRTEPDPSGREQGLDARVYNEVFGTEFPSALFVSSGGGGEQKKHSELALRVLSKAFDDVELRLLKDRDGKNVDERTAFLSEAPGNRMLTRREIENYLFDFEVLAHYAGTNGRTLDRDAYDALVPDFREGDLKQGQTLQSLKQLCGFQGTVTDFKLALASHLVSGMAAYGDLKGSIFS